MMNRFIIEINYSLRQPAVAFSLLLLLLVVLMFIGVLYNWYPKYSAVVAQKNQYKLIKTDYFEKQRIVALSEQYHQASGKIQTIEKKLNIKTSQSEIIKNISKLSVKNKLHIVKEAYKEEKDKKIIFLKQELALVGNYKNIKSFIYDVNNSPYLSHVKNSILERKKKSGYIDAKLTIISFMRNE